MTLANSISDLTSAVKKMSSMSKMKVRSIKEKVYRDGHHILNIHWNPAGDFTTELEISSGYWRAYKYAEEELPPTMESKRKIAVNQDEFNKHIELFQGTILNDKITAGQIHVLCGDNVIRKFIYVNIPIEHDDQGRVTKVKGFQVGED